VSDTFVCYGLFVCYNLCVRLADEKAAVERQKKYFAKLQAKIDTEKASGRVREVVVSWVRMNFEPKDVDFL